jgi:hypothetical protein
MSAGIATVQNPRNGVYAREGPLLHHGRRGAGGRGGASPESTRWHPFETAKIGEITFRALLTQDGAGQLELARA